MDEPFAGVDAATYDTAVYKAVIAALAPVPAALTFAHTNATAMKVTAFLWSH